MVGEGIEARGVPCLLWCSSSLARTQWYHTHTHYVEEHHRAGDRCWRVDCTCVCCLLVSGLCFRHSKGLLAILDHLCCSGCHCQLCCPISNGAHHPPSDVQFDSVVHTGCGLHLDIFIHTDARIVSGSLWSYFIILPNTYQVSGWMAIFISQLFWSMCVFTFLSFLYSGTIQWPYYFCFSPGSFTVFSTHSYFVCGVSPSSIHSRGSDPYQRDVYWLRR